MTPKEKADQIFDLMYDAIPAHPAGGEYDAAKQCALICCDEVLGYMGADRGTVFWQEVKQQIEKL
jgi:hypothetical protein